jgi:hypothetical protein
MEFEVVKAKEKPRKVTDWSQLSFAMSHEFRTPWTVYWDFHPCWVSLINEEQQEYIKLIQISGAYA